MTSNTEFVFPDGQGPVPAHEHSNGGGLVADSAFVADTAYIGRNAKVSGNAHVTQYARIEDNAHVFGNAGVTGNAVVSGDAWVFGEAVICDAAHVGGHAQIVGATCIRGNAIVNETPLVIHLGNKQIVKTPDWLLCGTISRSIDDWIEAATEEEIDREAGVLAPLLRFILEQEI